MTELKVLKFGLFDQFPELVHGISNSGFGNLSYKWAESNGQTTDDVLRNRRYFYGFLSVSEDNVVATQTVDGAQINDINQEDRGKGVTIPNTGVIGDGFFTNSPNTNLFVITGDCLVLFFYEPIKQVCGLVHAGWRGVDQELPRLAVEHMVRIYQCDPNEIRIGISPALQRESAIYENLDKFNQEQMKVWQPYIDTVKGGYRADWIKYAKDQLHQAGISSDNIEDCGIDTRMNTDYFSHRRSKEENTPDARFGCLIGIEK